MHGRYCLLVLSTITLLLSSNHLAYAQDIASQGVAEYLTVLGEKIENGHIVALTQQGYQVTNEPYDNRMFGVVTSDPVVAWGQVPKNESHAVIRSGTATVQINTTNGSIVAGDWITSSDTPGVGMKAIQPGFVLGRAVSSPTEGAKPTLVQVVIIPQFVSPLEENRALPLNPRDVISTLRSGYQVATSGAANFSVRYLLAVMSLLISLIFGYWAFIKTATNSVTAVGRNPLARRSILFVAAFNVVLAIAIVMAGLALAFFILAL